MSARLAALPGSGAQARQLRAAAPSWPGLAPPFPDFADPPPTQGSDDEIWMVSYMDIMTLLLTFFVLLFVYARTVAPGAVAAGDAQGGPPRLEAPHRTGDAASELAPGVLGIGQPVVVSPQWLGALTEPPIAELTIRFADATVTNPTVTVVSDTEMTTSALPATERAVDAVASEPLASPAEPADGPARDPDPSVDKATSLADTPPQDASAMSAESTAATREGSAQAPDVAGEPAPPPPVAVPAGPAAEVEQTLLAAIQASDLGRRVEVSVRKHAVNLEISDEILFDRGSAALTASGEALLGELAELLAQQLVRISVEGHTDDSPIRSERFASNWELSAARATNVTRSLIAHAVDPARVRAVGYADTRPRAANASEQGRARNRRVALVLHVPAGSESAW